MQSPTDKGILGAAANLSSTLTAGQTLQNYNYVKNSARNEVSIKGKDLFGMLDNMESLMGSGIESERARREKI